MSLTADERALLKETRDAVVTLATNYGHTKEAVSGLLTDVHGRHGNGDSPGMKTELAQVRVDVADLKRVRRKGFWALVAMIPALVSGLVAGLLAWLKG